MSLDIITPTRGNIDEIRNYFGCLSQQTYNFTRLYLILDKEVSKSELSDLKYMIFKGLDNDFTAKIVVVNNLEYDFVPQKGLSYVRNYGINLVESDYCYLIDNDNLFDDDFLEKSMFEYDNLSIKNKGNAILSPVIMYRKTGKVQSRGVRNFYFFLPKLFFSKNTKGTHKVKMIGANSLLAKSKIFKNNLFDETFRFVAEDLDFSYRLGLNGQNIYVCNALKIYHMERSKSLLEKKFISNSKIIHERLKNWIIFVKKNGTTFQKVQYSFMGLPFHFCWFSLMVLLYGKNKISLYKGMISGIKEGLKFEVI